MLMTESKWKILAVKVNITVTLAAHLFFEELNVSGFLKVISQETVKCNNSSTSYSLWLYALLNEFGAKISKTWYSSLHETYAKSLRYQVWARLRNRLEKYFYSIAVTRFVGLYACKHTDILGKCCFLGNFCDKCKAVDVACVAHATHSQIPPGVLPSEQVLGKIRIEADVGEGDKKGLG